MSYNFGKTFSYLFEDHEWLWKSLVGALILLGAQVVRFAIYFAFQLLAVITAESMSSANLASFGMSDREWVTLSIAGGGQVLGTMAAVVVTLTVWGFTLRLFRNVVAGRELPIPSWALPFRHAAAWRKDFAAGGRVLVVLLAYATPIFAVVGITAAIGAQVAVSTQLPPRELEDALVIIALAGSGVAGLFGIVYLAIIPAPIMRLAMEERIGAAFEMSAVFGLITRNVGSYFLALVNSVVASVLAGAGMLLMCVGVFATQFWAYLIVTHAFGQVYRLDLSARGLAPGATPSGAAQPG